MATLFTCSLSVCSDLPVVGCILAASVLFSGLVGVVGQMTFSDFLWWSGERLTGMSFQLHWVLPFPAHVGVTDLQGQCTAHGLEKGVTIRVDLWIIYAFLYF